MPPEITHKLPRSILLPCHHHLHCLNNFMNLKDLQTENITVSFIHYLLKIKFLNIHLQVTCLDPAAMGVIDSGFVCVENSRL